MIFIKLENELDFSPQLLENAASLILELSAVRDADLTLVLTGNDR